jgi:hypothetical protein
MDVSKRWALKQQEWEVQIEKFTLKEHFESHERRLEEEHQEELRDIRENAGRLCATLAPLGIEARVSERGPDPYDQDEHGQAGWIEIAESPIRWVALEWYEEEDLGY